MVTLATLEQATAQEVFDQVATHLLKQNKHSVDWNTACVYTACAYRGDNGLKCAAGCLIADDEYELGFEGYDWTTLAVRTKKVPDSHALLIARLQKTHDDNIPDEWYQDLRDVAKEFGLSDEKVIQAGTLY